MAKTPGALSRFVCTSCCGVELAAGGNTGFLCADCKPADHYTKAPQYLAHKAVATARRKGDLKPPSDFDCVDCGCKASVYDHRDYSKPLDVEPVCRRCNILRGPATAPKATQSLGPAATAQEVSHG